MHVTVRSAFADAQHVQIPAPSGQPLGRLFAAHASQIQSVLINGSFVEDWQSYTPDNTDRLTLYLHVQDFITPSVIIAAVISTIVSTALSLVLSVVLRALTPTPSRSEGKTEQVFGIAGLTTRRVKAPRSSCATAHGGSTATF